MPHSPAAAAAAEARRSWQGSRRPQQEPSFWQTAGRRRATPLLFSAACIVGGCALFIGAVQANQHLCAPCRVSHETACCWMLAEGSAGPPRTHTWRGAAGAASKAVFWPVRRYNHNKLEAAEQRISHPTERQQQIKDLITARRAEQQMQEAR